MLRVLKVPKVLRVLVLQVLQVLQVLLVPVLVSVNGAAQQPRDGIITGQVVDAATGKPVSAALVTIQGAGAQPPPARGAPSWEAIPLRILTGSDGRFVFRDLPAGSFTIAVTKSGYAEGASGRQRPGGTSRPVVLTEAQRTADATVRLWKYAAIAGTVTDEAGEPVVGVRVRVMQQMLEAGRRRLRSFGVATATDDRGAYRFGNLLPGDYAIVASVQPLGAPATTFTDAERTHSSFGYMMGSAPGQPSGIGIGDAGLALGRGMPVPPPPVSGRVQIYPPTFYPSTLSPAQATVVTVAAGEERSGIDLQLQPVPTARVSGLLVSPAGMQNGTIERLIPNGAEIDTGDFELVSGTDARGAFVFPSVTPGQYLLRSSQGMGDSINWAAMPIAVAGGDLDGIVATLRPELAIGGRLEFEGAAAPTDQRARAQIVVEGTEGHPGNTQARTEWRFPPAAPQATFRIRGYAAGTYLVRVTGSPAGWMFKSAMLNGVDVSETPFDLTRDVGDLVITFTDRWTGLGGSVQGADREGPLVIVFPSDPQRWMDYGSGSRRVRSARATADGRFAISSLPPGDYYVVALPEQQADDWRDPKTLERLVAVATPVTILEGQHRTIDLRLREVRH